MFVMSFLFFMLGAMGLFIELSDPRLAAAPEHSGNIATCVVVVLLGIAGMAFFYRLQVNVDEYNALWKGHRDNLSDVDLARPEAEWSNYWDRAGNRHRTLRRTYEGGEVEILEDRITHYAEIEPW
jgi:hypothetical protein